LRFTRASPPSGCTGDFHPQTAGHAQHTGRCAPPTAMPCGHPGLPLRATAWERAGRDGRMAVLIEQQDGCCGR
jgi:hypothetical protein